MTAPYLSQRSSRPSRMGKCICEVWIRPLTLELFSKLTDLDNLYEAFTHVYAQSGWKAETQLYKENVLFNLINLKSSLESKTYRPQAPTHFLYNERGKPRAIESRCVNDRIVQRCLSDQVLLPIIKRYIVYDNAASVDGRGTEFFRKRLKVHLRSYVRQYGTDGYILLMDYSKFFDNIRHDAFLAMLDEIIPDKNVMWLVRQLVEENQKDVSYMTDEEYSRCMDTLFNSLEYMTVDRSLLTGEKYMRKSLGIGSQISQIAGVYYPHRVDNFIKIVEGEKYFARYMDDSYIINSSKDRLRYLLDGVRQQCDELGIFINDKKTQIVPLSHSFCLLQMKYIVFPDSNIIEIPNSKTFTRERRKLKAQARKVASGVMTPEQVEQGYRSWRGNVLKYASARSVSNIDTLYSQLFQADGGIRK